MGNLAETVKKQTDRILRQRSLNQTEGVVVSGVSSGVGAPAPTVNNPQVDLTAHKASADHDGRYYTEAEVDALLANAGRVLEPLANGDPVAPQLIFSPDGDVIMVEV